MAEIKEVFEKKYNVFDPKKQRRKESRVRVEAQCNVFISASKNRSGIEATIVELSLGGIKFQSNTPFYAGDQVDVHFPLNKEFIKLKGTIIRVSSKNAIMKIQNLGEEEKMIIQNFIYNYYNSPPDTQKKTVKSNQTVQKEP
ncbi:MAG: PilZ domain-containing protein [Leptospiraceae bacterium]|nr:PilZ domain-containing protein [Leptospiraceae bacterium]